MKTRKLLALTALASWMVLVGCAPAASMKKTPITWKTSSGYPEVVLKGIQPREVSGLLENLLTSKGYKMVAVGDYGSDFDSTKNIEPGIGTRLHFDYLSLPGSQVKVISKPHYWSLGVLIEDPVEPEAAIVHFSHDVLQELVAAAKP